MKTKALTIAVSVWMAAGAVCLAANPNIGTWKLNEARSKLSKGAPKNTMVVYKSAMMGKVKVILDGNDGRGNRRHNEWTGRFDGREYPVSGDPNADMRSYKVVDDHTMELTVKKSGKLISSGRLVLASDGKSRTLIVNGTTPKSRVVAVYEKQ